MIKKLFSAVMICSSLLLLVAPAFATEFDFIPEGQPIENQQVKDEDMRPSWIECQNSIKKARSHMIANEYEEAAKDLSLCIEVNDGTMYLGGVYEFRGMAYSMLGKDDFAIYDFTEAIAAGQSNPRIYIFRSMSFSNKNFIEEAISDLNKAIEIDPEFSSSEVKTMHEYLMKKKETKEKLKGFEIEKIKLDNQAKLLNYQIERDNRESEQRYRDESLRLQREQIEPKKRDTLLNPTTTTTNCESNGFGGFRCRSNNY